MRTSRRGAALIVVIAAITLAVGGTGVAHGALTAGPANDRFGRAVDLTQGVTVEGTTVGATIEPGEPARSCSDEGVGTVWYRFRPQADGVAVLTLDSVMDLGIAVYTGNNVRNLTEIVCRDWAVGEETERAQVEVVAGVDYSVAIAGYTVADNASFTLAAQQHPRPANDDFADAGPLYADTPVAGTTLGATTEPGDPVQECTYEPTAPVWYRYDATESRRMTFTLDSPTDHGFSIYTGTSLADLELVGCVDDVYEWESDEVETLDVDVADGTTYWVAVLPWTFVDAAPFTLAVAATPPSDGLGVCIEHRDTTACVTARKLV